ncbi:MAG: HigA family addiction module antitoxin [Patescibacteria group bacterium]
MDKERIKFEPDYAIRPGEILEETLDARRIKKKEFAKRCMLSDKTISQIISGKAPITPDTAIRFERILGVSAAVWNNLESNYRLHVAKISSRQNLEGEISWAQKFPIAELVKRGLIERPINLIDAVEKLLNFFTVGSIEALMDKFKEMEANFRHSQSFKSAPESVASWLRIGEIKADEIDTDPFDKAKFISALDEIRKLTYKRPNEFEPKMIQLSKQAGVALVFVSELPNIHLSGATKWLHKDKALIILSLRHKSNDHFWFSFFHEAAHIIKHGKKQIFIDEVNMELTDEEKEADQTAANILIREAAYKEFIRQEKFYRRDIISFAKKVGIAPGIVVGRLQHDRIIPYEWHNNLKHTFVLNE